MGKILRLCTILGVATAVATGCNSAGCYDNGSSIPLAGFYSASTGAAIAVDSLQITGLGAPDTTALVSGKGISEAYLPMRAAQTSTSWVFEYQSAGINESAYNDTLTFDYESIPYFASEECGAMYAYRIGRVAHTTHLIESVELVDSLITNADRQTIHIYFRTDSGEGGRQ